ncbi:MAG: sulfite oxidase [Chloroflexota bacterium]
MDVITKDPSFIVRSESPVCGGPPLSRLVERPLTWREDFFVRSHGAIPDLSVDRWRLSVEGLVSRPLTLTLAELTARFATRDAVVTLQCAGNRRDELIGVRPIPGEVPWGAEAVSTARWGGASLADVLGAAGVLEGATHVWFEGLDEVTRHGHTFGFGSSIDLARALAGDVLLADRMNGDVLPAEHGFPLRAVIPGYIGARSVKWLGRIIVADRPTDNYFQSHAYKVLPEDVDPATADWDAYPAIEEAPLQAVICLPATGAHVAPGQLTVQGYATAPGHRRVALVEVSGDGGATWTAADLLDRPAPGAWSRWQATITLDVGDHTLVARVRDSEGGTGPRHVHERWNPKGYMNDAWHRIGVKAG